MHGVNELGGQDRAGCADRMTVSNGETACWAQSSVAIRTSTPIPLSGTRPEGVQDSFWAAVLTWRWKKSTSVRSASANLASPS